MAGKDYSQEAYQTMVRFEEMAKLAEEHWQDVQATSFKYTHTERVNKALVDMQLQIEHIIDLVDSKLDEIKQISNG